MKFILAALLLSASIATAQEPGIPEEENPYEAVFFYINIVPTPDRAASRWSLVVGSNGQTLVSIDLLRGSERDPDAAKNLGEFLIWHVETQR